MKTDFQKFIAEQKAAGATFETLSELQYSDDRTEPMKLYIYGKDGYHSGGVWFRRVPKYPEEEITTADAKFRTENAIAKGLEVRICDGGDMLVFHAKDGKVLFPADGKFWNGEL